MSKLETVVIGQSDYNRKEIEAGVKGWTIGSAEQMLLAIKQYEANGYTVVFKTSLLRKIFCIGWYKVEATRPLKGTNEAGKIS